ncbi:MAG: DUF4105 domain-containing protein, partial [Bacteroidales bacterium]|nr:DUF4105 domain-containing protein [Bacteroidales bacterium]
AHGEGFDMLQHPYSLDSNAFASLLTCGPGDEFYSTFGHTALRICDTSQGIDYAYNYGMFSFDEPHFYLNFARGRLNYFLGRTPFQYFLSEYAIEGRWVQEQRLSLSSADVCRLYGLLEENYKPENKHYMYDYFADNCATRVRDMICRTSGKQQEAVAMQTTQRSFRTIMYEYTQPTLQWWQLGIDLLLGARTDKAITEWQTMFAPNELMKALDEGKLNVGSDVVKQLLTENRKPTKKSISPTLIFWLAVVFVFLIDITSLYSRKRHYNRGVKLSNKRRLVWLDGFVFGIAGLLGVFLMAMWLGTDHYWTKENWNLLWANPLFLVLLFRLRKNNRVVAFFLLASLAASMALGSTGVLPQHFNAAVLPISTLLFVRTLYRIENK